MQNWKFPVEVELYFNSSRQGVKNSRRSTEPINGASPVNSLLDTVELHLSPVSSLNLRDPTCITKGLVQTSGSQTVVKEYKNHRRPTT